MNVSGMKMVAITVSPRVGASLPGLYPPNAEQRARYEAWKKARS